MKNFNVNKRKVKRAAYALTAGMMVFSSCAMFTACGSNDSSNNTAIVNQQEAMKTLAFDVTSFTVESNLSGNITCKNGLFYSGTYSYEIIDDIYYSNCSIVAFDETGTVKLTIPVYEQKTENDYGNIQGDISVDDAGNITCMVYYGSWNPDTGESEDNQKLITFDSTGKEIGSIELSDIVTEDEQMEGMYFSNYVTDAQGNIYCNLGTCVRVLDNTGKVLFTTAKIDNNSGWLNSMILTNTGVPAVNIFEYGEEKSVNKLVEIDINAKAYGKEYILGSSTGTMFSGSGDYICYTDSETGVKGVRADTLEPEPVLNLLNLGIDNSQMNSFAICEDGSFITTGWDYSGYQSQVEINIIKPTDVSQVKEKSILSLGCFYLNWNIRSAVADFNRNNENYTIYVTSYSDSNDTTDWSAALTKFNNEILAGNVPDILLLNSDMPYDSYASKGLFTDLYELIDNDPELTRESFMPNVLRAMERDGKLYEMTPSFSIQTYAAKTSLVGTECSITMEKAKEILAGMPEGAALTNYLMTQSEFLSNAIMYSSFVDYENATCNFDSPEFKAVLEMAKTYPAEIDYDKLYNENPDYWMDQETACKEDRALLYSTYLWDFDTYNRIRYAYFGEDITFVGFPGAGTEGSSSAVMTLDTQLAVSAKSKYKEGAWEFIKSILMNTVTEEPVYSYNGGIATYETGQNVSAEKSDASGDTGYTQWVSNYGSMPILVDHMNKLAEQATKPDYYVDENGNLVEQDNVYYVNNMEIKIEPITREDADSLVEYMKTVDKISRYDTNLTDIINEDSAAYFNGTKSVDETASIIQSRVSIYLSEQY